MENPSLRIGIIVVILCSALAYEVSKTNEKELIFISHTEDIKLFCRYHPIMYELELRGINEIKNKIANSIELLTQICNNVKYNHICLFMMSEIKILYKTLQEKSKLIKITQMQAKEHKITQILSTVGKTITLTDTTYNNLEQGLLEMQSLINFLGKHQNKLQDHLDYVNFDSLAQLTEMSLRNCMSLFESMIEIFIHKNFQHILNLLPTEIIRKDLITIMQKSQVESCEIPGEAKNISFNQILHSSNIESLQTDYSFIIKIKIPTAYENSFQLLQANTNTIFTSK